MLQWAFSRYNVYTIVVVVADKKGQAEGIMEVEGTTVLVVNLFRQCVLQHPFLGVMSAFAVGVFTRLWLRLCLYSSLVFCPST